MVISYTDKPLALIQTPHTDTGKVRLINFPFTQINDTHCPLLVD